MLKVKRLDPDAKMPTVGHPGEDLGFDVYALEDTVLPYGVTVAVRTGIAATFSLEDSEEIKFGLLFRDRSSMAVKGITVSAGVIDAGYTDELKILMTSGDKKATHKYCGLYGYDINPDCPHYSRTENGYLIRKGTKIAQMLPTEVFTAESIVETQDLEPSSRGMGGFGSTGA